MKILIREALAYTAGAGVALAVDIGILTAGVFCGAACFGCSGIFSMGLFVGYALCLTAALKYRRSQNQLLELAAFAAIGVVGLGITVAAIALGISCLGARYLVVKSSETELAFVRNFAASQQLLLLHRCSAK